jgi:hypothetical protein
MTIYTTFPLDRKNIQYDDSLQQTAVRFFLPECFQKLWEC